MTIQNALQAAQELEKAEAALQARIDECRAAGVTWEALGHAFGVSRQAMQKRFGNRSLTVVDESVH